MNGRRGLGRGLGALIPSGAERIERPSDVFFADTQQPDQQRADPQTTGVAVLERPSPPSDVVVSRETPLLDVPGARFAELPVDQISPNPRQPREVFDPAELEELAASIREVGVLQPVVVRRASGGDGVAVERYELVMGERRWRASRLAGLTRVPAIVRDTADDDLLRDALLENLHRSQLNALEEAAAYSQLLSDFGCTHDELARRIGRSRPQISNTVRLLRLPAPVQRRVAAGVLSPGHARALLALEDPERVESLASRIVAEGLSVRAVEEVVALGDGDAPQRRSTSRAAAPDPQLDDVAARLADRLDTRVAISVGRRRSRLSVDFASTDDLARILAVLGAADLLATAPGG